MWMIWKELDSDREVREIIHEEWSNKPAGYADMTPQEKAEALIGYWNSTLRSHDVERILIRVETTEEVSEKDKQNARTVL